MGALEGVVTWNTPPPLQDFPPGLSYCLQLHCLHQLPLLVIEQGHRANPWLAHKLVLGPTIQSFKIFLNKTLYFRTILKIRIDKK